MAEVEEQQNLNPDTGPEDGAPEGEEVTGAAIRFDVPPLRTYHFFKQFRAPPNPNNFFKGLKW